VEKPAADQPTTQNSIHCSEAFDEIPAKQTFTDLRDDRSMLPPQTGLSVWELASHEFFAMTQTHTNNSPKPKRIYFRSFGRDGNQSLYLAIQR
jgi:hypothetical protein